MIFIYFFISVHAAVNVIYIDPGHVFIFPFLILLKKSQGGGNLKNSELSGRKMRHYVKSTYASYENNATCHCIGIMF